MNFFKISKQNNNQQNYKIPTNPIIKKKKQ